MLPPPEERGVEIRMLDVYRSDWPLLGESSARTIC